MQETSAVKMTEEETSAETSEPTGEMVEETAESEFSGELNEPRWSVVSFESIAVSGLPYDEAKKWLAKLEKQKVAGLCIVTDEAAARILQEKN